MSRITVSKGTLAGVAIPTLSVPGQPISNGCRGKGVKDRTSQIASPIDLLHHYSYATSKRVESSVKHFYKYFYIPGIGNLAAGTLPRILTGARKNHLD